MVYVSIREYKPEKSVEYTYYLYLCESYRQNGKVKNKQSKLATLRENDIFNKDDAELKEIIDGQLQIFLENSVQTISEFDMEILWVDISTKLEKVRLKTIRESPKYKEMYVNRNNKNSYYKPSYGDMDDEGLRTEWERIAEEYLRFTFSNNKNSNYTNEEKALFKEMFKDIAKKYHPDIAKDDGAKMRLLIKIRDTIL